MILIPWIPENSRGTFFVVPTLLESVIPVRKGYIYIIYDIIYITHYHIYMIYILLYMDVYGYITIVITVISQLMGGYNML